MRIGSISQNRSKKIWGGIIILFLLLLGIGVGYAHYTAMPSVFQVRGILFGLSDNLSRISGAGNDGYRSIQGDFIGTIHTETMWYPGKDGEGFHVPAGSRVYTLDPESDQYESFYDPYSVLIQTPNDDWALANLWFQARPSAEVLTNAQEKFQQMLS